MIESGDIDEQDRPIKKPKIAKCIKPADVSGNRKKKQSSVEILLTEAITAPEPSTSNATSVWSRDEDKLVLEQIKMGFANEDDLVKTLHVEKLPNRSYSEIYDRFKFLMDVIANL